MKGFVYRCYDADAGLLYIGTTLDVRARMNGHRSQHRTHGKSPWVPLVDRIEVDEYPTWQEADAAERALIFALDPRFNVRGRRADVARAASLVADRLLPGVFATESDATPPHGIARRKAS